jgi:glycosyltransferase involved in cell wall biosynthesis
MKFLVLAPRFHTNLYFRIKALEKQGNSVKVITLYRGKSEYHKDVDINVVGIAALTKLMEKITALFRHSHLKSDFEQRLQMPSRRVKAILKNFQPDYVLLKAYQNLFAIRILIWAKWLKIPVLMLTQTEKNHIKGSKMLLKWNLRFFQFMNVKHFITPLKKNEQIFHALGFKNTHYLPFVFPVNDFEKSYFQSDKINILSIGKYVRRKDQLLLLKAIKILARKYPLHVTLIGEIANKAYFKSLKKYLEENKLTHIVDLLGHMNYEQNLQFYKENDIFVLPSYSEPAAYSPVEAMAHKLPVVCSNECGTSCYINPGENGEIFEAKKIDSLIENIEKIIADKEKLIKYANKAYDYCAKKHALNNFYLPVKETLQNAF